MAYTHFICRAYPLFVVILLAGCSPQHPQPLGPGATAPPLTAASWLNGQAPTPEDMRGKVVVVDVWAYWCGPCKAAIPELIKIYEHYQDRDDVMFIGLTAEGSERRETRQVVRELHVPWVNGTGAKETVDQLQVYAIPMVFVIGRDGKIVWNSDVPGEMTSAIDTALARGN